MLQSYSNNPKRTPKTAFGSTPYKELATNGKNETPAERIHFEKGAKSERRINFRISAWYLRYFSGGFPHKNPSQTEMDASLDAKFTALSDYITRIQRVDFANCKKSEKKDLLVNITMQSTIFPTFSQLKIHCKNTLNTLLDAEFNFLSNHTSYIERIDSWTWKRTQK